MNFIEIIGYTASILVAISLTMSQILRLRIINLLGAITFTIYGFLISAYPIFLVNGFIVIIDLYYLIKLIKNRDNFDTLLVDSGNEYLDKFLEYNCGDINNFFKDFKKENLEGNINLFILRNLQIVNLVSFKFRITG
jgi:hypothetical protein